MGLSHARLGRTLFTQLSILNFNLKAMKNWKQGSDMIRVVHRWGEWIGGLGDKTRDNDS